MRLSFPIRGLLGSLCTIFLTCSAFAQEYALDAPAGVGMRSSVEVGWTAPKSKDGLIEIRPIGEDTHRVAYAYTLNNPQAIQAPEVPGDYLLVLSFDGEDRVSQPLRVEAASATLEATDTVDAGAAITVAWNGPNNRDDRITFASPGGDPIRGAGYAYTGNSKGGTVALTAPQDAATYDIVYVSGQTVLARHPVRVGSIAATLTAAAEVPAGAPVEIGFDGPNHSGDLITFAARDGEQLKPASYTYTGNATGNTVTLRAPEEPGSYDIIYLSGDRVIGRRPLEIAAVDMAISAPDAVQARLGFEVIWSGQGNQGDRIVLVEPGRTRGDTYRYIDPLNERVAITAPEAEGDYELVYITRGSKALAHRPIIVTPAPLDPGAIEVQFAPGAGFGPNDAVEIILDASGSMLQSQNGERRIEIARRTLTGLISNTIPEGSGFALRVFGNREADACRTDLEIPLGPLDREQASAVIASINAINLARTPIAQSVALSSSDLASVTGSRVVILITDGEETCDGDPGQEIEAIRAQGHDVRVNIIGYAIDDSVLARTFEFWAAAGGGAYFEAADADELGGALLRATALPFAILDASGSVVGAGLTGDQAQTVPAGTYTVQIGDIERVVEVRPGETMRVVP